jgi:hypothetical protein
VEVNSPAEDALVFADDLTYTMKSIVANNEESA